MPPQLSGSNDRHQGLITNRGVHESTHTFTAFDNLRERSYESGNIVDGVIISTTTSKGEGGSVIFQSDVLDSGAVGDSELHDEKSKESEWTVWVSLERIPFSILNRQELEHRREYQPRHLGGGRNTYRGHHLPFHK